MLLPDQNQKSINEFFDSTAACNDAYQANSFGYLALRQGNKFILVQGALFLNAGLSTIPFTQFRSEHVRAGHYRLTDLNLNPQQFVEQLLTGKLPTPDGELQFPTNDQGTHTVNYTPFHTAGLQKQHRLSVLRVNGANQMQYLRQPFLDWELKAAATPFDGIHELMSEYHLGGLFGDMINVEVIAFNVAFVDFNSPIKGKEAQVKLRLAFGLSPEKVTLGYRAIHQGRVPLRSSIKGPEMQWSKGEEYQEANVKIEIPEAAVLHCIVSYDGIAQHFGWLADQATVQNARRSAYEAFDSKLETVKDIIAKAQAKKDVRDLEAAVGWLLWMLGFSVAHLGGTARIQDAVDLIATTPNGNFAVIECTTGLLKADNKLSILYDRAQAVRRNLDASNNRHLRVLPVIVTSKSRDEVQPDIEQAEKLGILVTTKEDLEQSFTRTMVFPNAEQLYEEAENNVRVAKALRDAQSNIGVSGLQPA